MPGRRRMTDTYDAEGRFLGDEDRAKTRMFTGRRVNPLNVRAGDVDIADIAHSLARQCRFNGQCGGFISVADHCVRVHDMLEGTGHEAWGLMHDAAEAYLGDLIRPMKYSGAFETYFQAEAIAEAAIAEAFDLALPIPQAVLDADNRALLDELGELWDMMGDPLRDEREFMERYRRHWA